MKPMKTTPLTQILTMILVLGASSLQSHAMYELQSLTKEKAEKSGVTIKSRPNGAAGTKVWLELKKDGSLGDFTFIELRMEDGDGKHLLSNRLQPHPVAHDQSEDFITVSFSVKSSQLGSCSFWLYKNGRLLGGEILTIKVSDFLDTPKEPSQ